MRTLSRLHVLRRTTFSNAQIYRVRDFPQPISISNNRVAWYEFEIDEFLLSRPRSIPDGLIYKDLEAPSGVRVFVEKKVCDYVSISRAQLNRMIRAAEFPSPIKLSVQKIGYLKHEVDYWLYLRPRAHWSPAVQTLH